MPFEWTSEHTDMLKNLWSQGISARKIASTLGSGISRNAVIGKAHRLGLSTSSGKKNQNHKKSAFSLAPSERSCQWPIGHPGDIKFHFCGKPIFQNRPYCEPHCNIAYRRKISTNN